jgi:transposase-like protein
MLDGGSLKRRTRVVRVFPNAASCLPLVRVAY